MDAVALYSELRRVEIPKGGYGALPIGLTNRWWIGRDSDGALALLVEEITDAIIRTSRLDVASNLNCRINVDNHQMSGVFTVVRLRDADPAVEEYFVDLCVALERWHSAEPARPLGQIVLELASFFDALAAPPRTTQLGLWAELLVIRESRD